MASKQNVYLHVRIDGREEACGVSSGKRWRQSLGCKIAALRWTAHHDDKHEDRKHLRSRKDFFFLVVGAVSCEWPQLPPWLPWLAWCAWLPG